MVPLTEKCREKVRFLFAREDERVEVEQLLVQECGDSLPLYQGDYDRIRFAVLKLSKGDLKLLWRQVEGANVDWRDTLVAADFGDDDRAHLKWTPTK